MDTIKKQRNIILIYIHTFLSTFILYYICDTLFYIERGLTSSQYISFVGIAFGIRLVIYYLLHQLLFLSIHIVIIHS